MKTRAGLYTGVCTAMIGAGVALSGYCLAAPVTVQEFAVQAAAAQHDTEPPLEASLALKGTDLLHHSESIQGVDGNPNYVIDQRQYDQARAYFLKQIAATPSARDKLWQPSFSTLSAYAASMNEHRQHLRRLLGLVELKPQKAEVKLLDTSGPVQIQEISVVLDGDFALRALLFRPRDTETSAGIIAIPDANQSPEDFAGIAEGMATAPWLRTLLARGITVAIPQMVERLADHPLCQSAGGQDRRRVLWRMGYITDRSLLGMEVEQVAALRDYLSQHGVDDKRIGVWGEGQGGMTALYAAAVDERLAGATVTDYFQQREESWTEPVDRMLYGQLNEFGDAEVAALIAPRPLTIVARWGGPVAFASVRAEEQRARRFYRGLGSEDKLVAKEETSGAEDVSALEAASMLGADHGAEEEAKLPEIPFRVSREQILKDRNQHFEGLYRYGRRLLTESDAVRTNYWKLSSTPPQGRAEKAKQLREELGNIVGRIPTENTPLHARTRLIGETEKFLAYEVLLDTAPGVEAYGQLLVPRSVAGKTDERLPAIVCQHGLGGAPQYVSGVGANGADVESNEHFYHRFGERLAERGYVVFAPYLTVPSDPAPPSTIHRADLINPLVREAATLGMLRTSLELAKLHRIVDFLQSLSFVDGARIGYYGLSYGGYSAIWMPPLEPRLKFTIISGYFNDLLPSLITENSPNSFWGLPDLDMYPWNGLNRFTHTELIAAMWPRPVSVEWGLDDPTTTPEWHKLAWQDVKEKYADPWEMGDKVVSEDYVGVHTIHGIGTFSFIDRWLRPERSAARDYGCDGDSYCNWSVAPGGEGYSAASEVPYVTQLIDSAPSSVIRGRFYVSDHSPQLTGMALKLSRTGDPGDLVLKLGSQSGRSDIGELRFHAEDVYSSRGLWYELKLEHPVVLDPKRLYWFEVTSASGSAPHDGYLAYGPRPLGGADYPGSFGLSFKTLTKGGE